MKNGNRRKRTDAFAGRSRELAAIRDALADAAEGRRRIVALAGPPGIGKTRTVTQACASFEAEGVSAHWVRCSSQSGVPPFWVWEQLIKSVAPSYADECFDPIKRLYRDDTAGYATGAAQRARFEVFERVVTCVKRTAEVRPLALVLDDLQWADQASLSLLEYLTRQTPDVPLILIITLRTTDLPLDHPASITVGEIIRESGAESLTLSGLTVDEVKPYVGESMEIDPTDMLAETIYAITDGNPFYLAETLRELPRGQDPAALIEVLRSSSTPESLVRTIASRISHNPDKTANLLAIAAQTGRSFAPQVLQTVCDTYESESVEKALIEGADAGIIEIRDDGERFRFTHVLFQDVLRSQFAPLDLAGLHLRIAEAKETYFGNESEQHSLELAYHYRHALAGRRDDREALKRKLFGFASLAGRQALKARDFRKAAELLEQAVASAGDDTPTDEAIEVLKALGIAESRLRRPKAIERIEKAMEILGNEGRSSEAARSVISLPINSYRTVEENKRKGVQDLVSVALENF